MTITTAKIFGERHTGTNAAMQLIHQNFHVDQPYYAFLGWKHRKAPLEREWRKYKPDEVLFVFMVRSPYSWLKAMHRDPYYYHQPKINQLEFRYFIQHSMEDYENVIQLWNEKNASYIRMHEEVPHSVLIRMEDFILCQERVWQQIANKINGGTSEYVPYDKYIGGRGAMEESPVNSGLQLPPVPDETYQIINKQIDPELMDYFCYDYKSGKYDKNEFDETFLNKQEQT